MPTLADLQALRDKDSLSVSQPTLADLQALRAKDSEPSFGDQAMRQLGLTGRHIIEGATALPLMVGDAANSAINLGTQAINNAIGTKIPALGMPSQTVSNTLTQVGLPQPQNGIERVVGGMSQALAGTGAEATLAKGVQKLAPLANDLWSQMKSALGSSAASGVASEADAPAPVQMGAGLLGGIATMRRPSIEPITSQELKTKASNSYKNAEDIGGKLTPNFTNQLADELNKLKPEQSSNGSLGEILNAASRKLSPDQVKLGDIADTLQGIRDNHMTLQEAQRLDEMMSDGIDGFWSEGKLSKAGKKLLDTQTKFREMIANADESQISGGSEGFDALNKGRELWSQAAKVSDIERILSRAENMDKPATGIKNGFNTLLNNPSRMRGYTSEQKALIKDAARTGIVSDGLRTLASRLIPVGQLIKGDVGGALASFGTSEASNSLAEMVQRNKANKVINSIIGAQKQPLPTRATVLGATQGTIPYIRIPQGTAQ